MKNKFVVGLLMILLVVSSVIVYQYIGQKKLNYTNTEQKKTIKQIERSAIECGQEVDNLRGIKEILDQKIKEQEEIINQIKL